MLPKKFAAGVKLTDVPSWLTVPLAGCVTAVMVSVSPLSGAVESLASTSITIVPLSSATVTGSSFAVGGSLSGVTMTVTVAVSSPPAASEIV